MCDYTEFIKESDWLNWAWVIDYYEAHIYDAKCHPIQTCL